MKILILFVAILAFSSCASQKSEDAMFAPIVSDILLDVRREFNRPIE